MKTAQKEKSTPSWMSEAINESGLSYVLREKSRKAAEAARSMLLHQNAPDLSDSADAFSIENPDHFTGSEYVVQQVLARLPINVLEFCHDPNSSVDDNSRDQAENAI